MANVGRLSRRRSDATRGQLFLVGALSLAVVLVVLALLMNTAIYTENLATRGADTAGGQEVIEHRYATAESVTGTIAYVNRHNNSSYGDLHDGLQAGIADWDDASARHQALKGHATEVQFVDRTNGTRIEQSDDGAFTDANSAANWTLVEDVRARAFRMWVNSASGEFRVVVEDGVGTTWGMNVTQQDGNVIVGVDGETCSTGETPAEIDLTAGTVGGDRCEALWFAEGLDGRYDIRYENGDTVEGRYELVVDKEVEETNLLALLDDNKTSRAIYDATVTVTYDDTRLQYTTEMRVAPGERDE